VEIDYSNEENWIAATLSGCPTMLREVQSGDIHLATAITLGLAPPGADADEYAGERKRAKTFTHGSNYGISAYGISRKLKVPIRRAAGLLGTYDREHSVFRTWQQALVRHAYSTRRITAPMGWSMYVNSAVTRRTLLNWPCQVIGGEILRAAVVMLVARGFTICATAHDSVYFLMPLDGLADQITLASEVMASATLPFTGGYPIPTKVLVVRPGERLLDTETRPMWERILTLAGIAKEAKTDAKENCEVFRPWNTTVPPVKPRPSYKRVSYESP
jgi:hypothetical protein